MKIEMVDLKGQYVKIQDDIDSSVLNVIREAKFINGPAVAEFTQSLSAYLGGVRVIPCANGTDALQIAMMSLDLKPGDEVIVPAFSYVASAEVIGLLKLKPVIVDVDPQTFNMTRENIVQAITSKTKAIVPVHLFGQCADMEPIMELADKHGLFVIEDTAQAIGADYIFTSGSKKKAGTIGHIGCTSFFPSKNLGCYGDGGAIYTNDEALAERIRMIANHGQVKKYVHKYIGVNSRLDTLQAAILNVKLKYLDNFSSTRSNAADLYDCLLAEVEGIITPFRSRKSSHVFHQYTLRVADNKRDSLKTYLESFGIPTMIYYPVPLNEQEAFHNICAVIGSLSVTMDLCNSVLSLPMHTELSEKQQVFIASKIKKYFNK
jgi:UDP-2-acetamido-2-deoxy-ribo-hexuluronate aminotransferase